MYYSRRLIEQKEGILVLDINQKKTQGSCYSVAADIRVGNSASIAL